MQRPSNARPSFVPEQRKDPVTGLWHIVAPNRSLRPDDFEGPIRTAGRASCQFCRGNEAETTETLSCHLLDTPEAPTTRTTADWQVRVVANLFPACTEDAEWLGDNATAADLERKPSRGRHEVIIETPDHRRAMTQLNSREVEAIMFAYRHRFLRSAETRELTHAMIFKNSGRIAGMSREHVHSQLVAFPETPPLMKLELVGAERHFAAHGRCVFCDLIDQTQAGATRIVMDTSHFLVFCPFASRIGYETWILPKTHHARFESTSDEMVRDLAHTMHRLFAAYDHVLPDLAFNYVLHSLPFDMLMEDHYHWHIELIPRRSFIAGLEWGAGVMISTVDPDVAAGNLRGAVKERA